MSETQENSVKRERQLKIWIISGVCLCLIVYAYFLYQKYFPSTDDAYVQAHVVDVAPQVSGLVDKIYVDNNQFVKKGTPLFDIDARPFNAALMQAQAQLSLAEQAMLADVAAVKVAQANVEKAQAQLDDQKKSYNRAMTLVKKGEASVQSGDDAKAQYDSAVADLTATQQQLIQAQQNLGEAGDNNAQIRQARANLETAKLNLSYTHITAPADGYVTNFELRKGSMVGAGQTIFEFVESHCWYVYANYKETQLGRIQANQLAKIKLDMYPKHTFHGYVASISDASGDVFSLLPPENATGNWVKVTQRFPVKIIITDADDKYPLRVGASSDVKIDTLKKYKKS